ncbi:hypothetical protein Y032_0080g1359 [Ancylostoma ceylanicum]|uniref:Uncharacterized protein n=1 Tax=Ancylostoma ceylanicum TaxID=53326 RepID=A0A016TT16_9BILA|nr:hypothetical protein Y032_0080g1359 [Ancylostoma ceylanicum]
MAGRLTLDSQVSCVARFARIVLVWLILHTTSATPHPIGTHVFRIFPFLGVIAPISWLQTDRLTFFLPPKYSTSNEERS